MAVDLDHTGNINTNFRRNSNSYTNFRRNSNSYETAFLYLSFFHVIQTVQIDRTEVALS